MQGSWTPVSWTPVFWTPAFHQQHRKISSLQWTNGVNGQLLSLISRLDRGSFVCPIRMVSRFKSKPRPTIIHTERETFIIGICLDVMYNALWEYKNMKGQCFLIIIERANTDIIDTTTVILHKTQNWLVAPPAAHLWPYSCDKVSVTPRDYFL